MSDKSSNNKRIAKNTVYLYIRMLFSMAVSLYTSRVILATLGVMDYGIWNLVGGVIALFSFLNTSMSGATARFLSYEIGKGVDRNVQRVFSGALTIHILIACCVLLLGETVGLWFLWNKLVIPEDRMLSANIVYQFTILSAMVSITQVPYNSQILSNERMNVYAYVEIINVALRLCIVYLLVIISFDKLIVYGFLTLSVSLSIAMVYRIYCIRNLEGCAFKVSTDRAYLRPMLSFSGWDLYGNMAVMARTQGVNMILNMFFTAVMNAASGIATQVQGAVGALANNILVAFRPQIVKSYAQSDNARMVMLIQKASLFTTMLLLLFTVPICAETDYIFDLWLVNSPSYATAFTRYTLIFNLVANLSSAVMCGIHATGRIKRSSIINGSLYLLVIPFSYLAFKLGGQPSFAYIFNIVAVLGGLCQNIYCLHKFVPDFSDWGYVKDVLVKCFLTGGVAYLFSVSLHSCFPQSFIRMALSVITSWCLIGLSTFYWVMTKNERIVVAKKISALSNIRFRNDGNQNKT